jgi:predicted nucleic acid-binding Zn ribbon protein
MTIDVGAPVAWLRKIPGRAQPLRIYGRVAGQGHKGQLIIAANGTSFEVGLENLRVLKPCAVCGQPVGRMESTYCSPRCSGDARIERAKRKVFDFLIQFKTETGGLSPSIEEIRAAVQMDKKPIIDALHRLAEDGLIWFDGGERRRQIGVKGGRWVYEVQP